MFLKRFCKIVLRFLGVRRTKKLSMVVPRMQWRGGFISHVSHCVDRNLRTPAADEWDSFAYDTARDDMKTLGNLSRLSTKIGRYAVLHKYATFFWGVSKRRVVRAVLPEGHTYLEPRVGPGAPAAAGSVLPWERRMVNDLP